MLYSHYQGAEYYIHSRIAPGIFQVRHSDQVRVAKGYPTATVITMDTLRPQCNYVIEQTTMSFPVQVLGKTLEVELWEAELLNAVSDTPHSTLFMQHIELDNIITCSDGSARPTGGTFGFIVSTSAGNPIAKGSGPAPSSNPSSFRSEAYGVLATMRWLLRALQGHTIDHRPTITHYLDNNSVITRIKNAVTCQIQAPSMTLLPEHDIITEIAATLRDLPVQIDFQWVKGHQDSNKSYNELEIPARLNCDADRAASLYQWPANKSHQKIPPLPNTPCQLVINNKIITSHIKQHIRSEATEPELMEYLKKKFLWDDHTLTTIDWNSFQQIIQKYTTQRSTVVKHLHAISPTGHIAHRNNTHMPHDCPACAHPEEDNMHLLTCTHESRISWRADTIAAIACYVPETSDPYLLDILRDG